MIQEALIMGKKNGKTSKFFHETQEITDYLAENDFSKFTQYVLNDNSNASEAVDFLRELSRKCREFAERLEDTLEN